MAVDPRELRNCLGHFTTGVTVVTCHGADAAHGMTINAFTSVSLDPPLILISVDRQTKGCALLQDAPFTVNILDEGQRDVALHFAGRPQVNLALEWEDGKLAPRLVGCLAYLECEPWQAYDGGDHILFVGRVHQLDYREGEPLLFHTGRFHELGSAYDIPWLESLDCPTAGWLGQLPADARRGDGTDRGTADPSPRRHTSRPPHQAQQREDP